MPDAMSGMDMAFRALLKKPWCWGELDDTPGRIAGAGDGLTEAPDEEKAGEVQAGCQHPSR